jgi:Domain of unknown function (DUF1707)
MATDDPIRASDADRDVVVDVLREAFSEGRLTLDEFDERMSDAYASRTWGELRELTADLPVQPVLGADLPGRQLPAPPSPPPYPPWRAQDDQVPQTGPEAQPTEPAAQPGQARRPVGIFVPVLIWTLLVAHGAAIFPAMFVVAVVFLLAVSMSGIRRRLPAAAAVQPKVHECAIGVAIATPMAHSYGGSDRSRAGGAAVSGLAAVTGVVPSRAAGRS